MKTNKMIVLVFLLLSLFMFSANKAYCKEKEGGKGKVTNKVTNAAGDAYRFNINNINLPLSRVGVLADVQIGSGQNSKGGVFDGQIFLYSAGFFLSGKNEQGNSWANGVASASRIQDYLPGPVGKDNNIKAQLYVVSATDAPFSQSWQDWRDAVEMGANFYDGDNDGVYNPVDKNGNGIWDANEDRPDLICDQTVWCVYNDNVPASQRTFSTVNPQGIEIRQTAYAINSSGTYGSLVFVRYEIENKGTSQVLDSVDFTAWADPDIGTPTDDLVGCDTLLNAAYTYNNGPDGVYGSDPPSAIIGLLQGPASFIPGVTFIDANGNGKFDEGETALQSAYEINGKYRGVKTIPGAKNLSMSSFVHYLNGDITIGDPTNQYEVRNYQFGLDRAGHQLNPCTWNNGTVTGVDCNQVDKKYWYSGDPVTGIGWVNNTPRDQRTMLSVGPFKLEKTKPVSIVVAYIVGRGTDAKNSVTIAKDIDRQAQLLFDNNFNLQGVPYRPVLVSPTNGSMYQETNLSLAWSNVLNADTYTLQVATDPGFSNLIVNNSTLTTNYKAISGLLNDTHYYWRVSAKNSSGNSQYSSTFSFTTKGTPRVPVLSTPNNGAVNILSNLTLAWLRVSDATSYRLQVAADPGFSNLIVNDSTITDSSKTISGLLCNSHYYWRVNAKNSFGTSTYSTVFDFTTLGLPGIPVLVNPTNYALYQETNLTLTWNTASNVNSYRLQVATDSGFSNLIVNDSTITINSKAISGLLNDTRYYWRVNSKNSFATSQYSSTFSFTTKGTPRIPILRIPLNGTVRVPANLSVAWLRVPDAISYRLQVAADLGFANLIVNDSTITDSCKAISGLLCNTRYYWKVNAKNTFGTSAYSTVFHFTTLNIPGVPLLSSPINGASNVSTNMTFTWLPSEDAASYKLQVASDSEFINTLVNDSALTSTFRYVSGLSTNTSYYWRVNATNYYGTSAYSGIWRFHSSLTNISDEQNAIPTEYGFYQNYPNPFNPSTVIKYDLPREGFVTIKVYNILGKEIKTLVSDFKRAGSYNVTFDAGNLPSGIYLCRIKSNDFSAVRKLLLIK